MVLKVVNTHTTQMTQFPDDDSSIQVKFAYLFPDIFTHVSMEEALEIYSAYCTL